MNNTKFFSILTAITFIFYTGLNLHYSNDIIEKDKPLEKVENFEFKILLLEHKKIKRELSALIQYDQEHWENYTEILKENGEIIFPRTDYYCGDAMVGNFIYNICEAEENEFIELKKLLSESKK
jgi:hypothetical protein